MTHIKILLDDQVTVSAQTDGEVASLMDLLALMIRVQGHLEQKQLDEHCAAGDTPDLARRRIAMNKFDRLGPPKWQLRDMTISPLRRAPKLKLVSESGQVHRTQTGDRVEPKLAVAETDVERTRRQWEENERGKNDYVDQINHDLRELVVNVMRTMRGAGKPYEICDQVVSLADTMLRCYQYFGYPHDYDAFRRSAQLCYFSDEDREADKSW
jgi:hypothetical protein